MSLRKLAFALGALLFLLADSPGSRGDATREAASPDERLLQEVHVGTDDASLLAFLRKNTASDADLLSLDALIRQLGSSQFRAREEASQKLTALGAAALVRLNRALTDPDVEIVRRATACLAAIGRRVNTDLPLAVVRRLVQRHPPGTLEALLRYLPSAPGEETVEEIVYGMYGLAAPDGKVHPVLVSALKDPLATRRAGAACIVGRLGNPAQREAVRSLLADTDPMVRLRAAQGLLAAKEKASIPGLVALLEEPAVEVSWQAEELLHWVASDTAPDVCIGTASAPARQQCRQAWEEWWSKHSAKLDLARLDQDHRRPGLVFICNDVPDPRQDAVWLCGCDGKPRWQLGNLSAVRDMRLLPGNRVLLAQWPAGDDEKIRPRQHIDEGPTPGVTVRDLEGKILWRCTQVSGPLESWPLPSGNIFITGRLIQVAEAAPDGREVTFRDFLRDEGPVHLLMAPQRLGNGRLLARSHGSDSRLEKLLEVDASTGRVFRTVVLAEPPREPCSVQALAAGRYLIADHWAGCVREFDSAGQVVWRCLLPQPFQAERLRNGNTLVNCPGDGTASRLLEVDGRGRVQWEAFTFTTPALFRSCLGLVRLGFDQPRVPDLDLAASVPYRLQGLRSKDVRIRRGNAYQVRQLGPRAVAAIPALIDALSDPDVVVRSRAGEAFTQFGALALPHLLRAAQDKRARVREQAIGALGELSIVRKLVVPTLLEALEDDSVLVRRNAGYALHAVLFANRNGIPPAPMTDAEVQRIVPALTRALQDKDLPGTRSVVSVPERAAYILADIGPKAKQAVPALIGALKTDDWKLRAVAMYALGHIGPAAGASVPHLLKVFKPGDIHDPEIELNLRRRAIVAIGEMHESAKDAVPTLGKVVEDMNHPNELRKHAIEALAKGAPKNNFQDYPTGSQTQVVARRGLSV
jgi:HEAT repeat protein